MVASVSYLPSTVSRRRASLQQIDLLVSARLGPTRGLGKSQPACFNRQMEMYLASEVGRWSTTSIGRFYGGRDHSTVLYAIQRVRRLRASDPAVEALLTELQAELSGVTIQKPDKLDPIRGMAASRDWEVIADRIASRVCEQLKHELGLL